MINIHTVDIIEGAEVDCPQFSMRWVIANPDFPLSVNIPPFEMHASWPGPFTEVGEPALV